MGTTASGPEDGSEIYLDDELGDDESQGAVHEDWVPERTHPHETHFEIFGPIYLSRMCLLSFAAGMLH